MAAVRVGDPRQPRCASMGEARALAPYLRRPFPTPTRPAWPQSTLPTNLSSSPAPATRQGQPGERTVAFSLLSAVMAAPLGGLGKRSHGLYLVLRGAAGRGGADGEGSWHGAGGRLLGRAMSVAEFSCVCLTPGPLERLGGRTGGVACGVASAG
jgi:hypothetical protein